MRAYEWQFSPVYWDLKRSLSKLSFRLFRWGFAAKSLFRGTVESGSILAQLARITSGQLVFALLLVGSLIGIEHIGQTHHWPLIAHALSADAQLSFLSTLLQVSAAFLTLYFTAVSVVTSTGYARAPGRVRYLVMQEQVGSLYFRTLAQFVGVTTVMLGALALKVPVGVLNTAFAAALCLFAAFSFVVLGIRTFHYFDPIAFVPYLNRLILQSVRAVTPAGYQWEDASFQHHHQEKAEGLLNIYADLVSVSTERDQKSGKGLLEIGRGLLMLASTYAAEKGKIPTSSLWFRKQHHHKQWLLASYYEVEVALVTGTIPLPESEPDILWFETKAARILAGIAPQLEHHSEALASFASSVADSMMVLGASAGVHEAMILLNTVGPHFRTHLPAGGDRPTGPDSDQLEALLAVIDTHSYALIQLVLAVSGSVARLTVPVFDQQMSRLCSSAPAALYAGTTFPRTVIKECEWVQGCVAFELSTDRRITTPEWFQKERPARAFVGFLGEAAEILVTAFEEICGTRTQRLAAEEQHVLLAQSVQRGLECAEKLRVMLSDMQTACRQYSDFNRSKEWEWPKADWNAYGHRVATVREQLVVLLAASAPFLRELRHKNLSDYFGQAYSVMAEECFCAMLMADDGLLSKLFPPFFAVALQAFERLRQRFLSEPQNIRFSTEPLSDLLALSGYALIFSELDGTACREIVEKCWGDYLASDREKAGERIGLFCLAAGLTKGLAAREILRVRWKQALEHSLRKRNLLVDRMGDYLAGAPPGLQRHKSALIRAFVRGASLFREPQHVFLSVFLLRREEAKGIEKPRQVENFDHWLEREENPDRGPDAEYE
jgi:hypothetical protein